MKLLLVCALALIFGGCCSFSARGYRGPKSDHFDGEKFLNTCATQPEAGFFGLLSWVVDRDPGPWPEWLDEAPGEKPRERVGRGELVVTAVGHATMLIQMDGLNILTDPVWSEAIGPEPFTVTRRHRAPGLRFEDLPPIDLVLISHDHYDHLDVPTLRRLMAASSPRIGAGLGTSEFLRSQGIRGGRDFDWWDSHPVSREVTVTAVPNQHFSNRGICDRDRVLWTAFVISGPAGKVYIAGDTGYGPHFAEVGQRMGPFRLAILPIGAFRPEWFMDRVHVSPEEALAAAVDLRAEQAMGYHFGTFRLADDGFEEPGQRIRRALAEAGLPGDRFWVPTFGEGRVVPRR